MLKFPINEVLRKMFLYDISRYKKLSYRKQIAHQLLTQYVEGIYINP